MKIVIDARMYGDFGIGRYNKNLIRHLQKIDKTNKYFILHLKEDFEKYQYQENFTKVKADFHWYGLTEQFKLPFILNKIKPDLVHFPHFNVPFFYGGNFVMTIHDLTHQYFAMKRATTHSGLMYFIKQKGYQVILKNAVNKSRKIITPSNYVKDLIKKEYEINNEKIEVTPEAVEEKLISLASNISEKEIGEVTRKFNIKPPFIFYVGNAHPHKNVEGLIKTFIELRKSYQNLTLVLSGHDKFFWERIKSEYKHKDIIYTGKVSDKELVALYKSAQVYVCPSLEEGFGIPLLEAMGCGVPVISSNKASLPEVGGDAAIYFDSLDQTDMVTKIKEVLDNQKLRKDLIEKGLKRYKQFSWEKLAKATLEVYKDAVVK